jgi:Smg protein
VEYLDLESRGFLMFLEQMGILTPNNRELVIDRVLALDADDMDLEQLKWIVLMVLFNDPGQEAAYAWMEDLVFDNVAGTLH